MLCVFDDIDDADDVDDIDNIDDIDDVDDVDDVDNVNDFDDFFSPDVLCASSYIQISNTKLSNLILEWYVDIIIHISLVL